MEYEKQKDGKEKRNVDGDKLESREISLDERHRIRVERVGRRNCRARNESRSLQIAPIRRSIKPSSRIVNRGAITGPYFDE